MSLGSLTIDIAANLARLQSDLGEGYHLLEKFSKSAEKFIGSLAIGVGANEFREWIAGAIEAADAAGKAAQKIGISTEAYTSLAYAASLGDVSAEDFTASMVKLDKAIDAAATGTGAQAAAFSDLGIKVKTASGELRSADGVLLDIAERFSKLKDGPAKTAAAMDIFGKSGASMVPLLNGGAEAIRNLQQEAVDLGVVISGESAAAAEEFNDSLTTLHAAASGLALSIATELLPTLNNVTAASIEMAKAGEGGSLAGKTLALGLKVLATVGAEVSLTFRDIGDAIAAAAAAAGRVAHGEFKQAALILDESTKKRDEMIAQTDKFVERVWSEPAEAAAHSEAAQLGALQRVAAAQQEAAKKAEQLEEQRKKKIEDMVAALERQAATIGQTASEVKLYELAQLKATAADIKRAEAAQRIVDAYQQQQEVYQHQTELLDRISQLGQEALSPEARAVDELREKYDDLNRAVAEHQMSQEEAGRVKGGLSDNFMRDIDDELKTDEERLKDSYDRRAEMLEDAHRRGLLEDEKYQRTSAKLAAKYAKDAEQLELQKKAMILGNAASIADGLAGIAEVTAGKQSGIYRVLFAASKAFAIAEAIVKIQAGIAEAAAMPWPTNIPAMASVVAATASIVPTIRGTEMGSAHAGLDYVPEDATYVLKQGERVLAAPQNRDLADFMSKRDTAPTGDVHYHFHGVEDFDSFRRSKRQLNELTRRANGG